MPSYAQQFITVIFMKTIGIREAADLLGFTSTAALSHKAKRGLIPGAFKAGVRWMFIVEKLVEFINELENNQRKIAQVNIDRKNIICRSAKRKTARIGIPGSPSAELEFRNQLAALYEGKHRNTKTGENRKLETKFS